ncbi:MAG: glycosyltransferase [Desulfovibrio sp.]|jgi:hypothetical protein|nr:glycosyltransferase [Desulfovibrio sp.]
MSRTETPCPQPSRPRRIGLKDFTGRVLTLSDAPGAWERHGNGPDALLMGLGPGDPSALPFVQEPDPASGRAPTVHWVEEPVTLERLRSRGAGIVPEDWREASPDQVPELAARCRCFFHRQGLLLAPAFWTPLLGAALAAQLPRPTKGRVRPPAVLLPGNDAQLLHVELRLALQSLGLAPVTPAPDTSSKGDMQSLADAVEGHDPLLFLSVNFRGLDRDGRIFACLRALGVPVAIWFVDNPRLLLTSIPNPWWKEASLFVTDASFIRELTAAGARNVRQLPLAAAPHMIARGESLPHADPAAPPLFVGRSVFPDHDRFFAAAHVAENLMDTGMARARSIHPPDRGADFHWWRTVLRARPWPSQDVRNAGFAADACSRHRRAAWITAAAKAGCRIVGDMGWQREAPGIVLAPPVDYFGSLPDLYARASAVLNVTSLLLPHSLSQRHFDAWAAGGLCLTDATPGMGLFPRKLADPVTLDSPEAFADRMDDLRAHPARWEELRRAWRDLIVAGHTYGHRIRTVAETLGVQIPLDRRPHENFAADRADILPGGR